MPPFHRLHGVHEQLLGRCPAAHSNVNVNTILYFEVEHSPSKIIISISVKNKINNPTGRFISCERPLTIAMRQAAGLSMKSNDAEPFKKKKIGRNVDAFIAREDQLNQAMRHTKVSDHVKGRAIWEDKQGKRGTANLRHRTQKQYVSAL
jgi:hypothetical protein